ncbi:uncharacterized protein L201_006753 [Kwoniella dendrophila CBS 6074]|uniref:Transmembrane protein n=1 Tax=Kwoniella dendrophila CBS 6074 TaxID=1295534 RepID=A0AAX4K2J7_9TREE
MGDNQDDGDQPIHTHNQSHDHSSTTDTSNSAAPSSTTKQNGIGDITVTSPSTTIQNLQLPPLLPNSKSNSKSSLHSFRSTSDLTDYGDEGSTLVDHASKVIDFSSSPIGSPMSNISAYKAEDPITEGRDDRFYGPKSEDQIGKFDMETRDGIDKTQKQSEYDIEEAEEEEGRGENDNRIYFNKIPKTPKTPKQFIQDHIRAAKIPLTSTSSKFNISIPTHIDLPTPIMPIIHLLLLASHLVLSALIPYLLVKHFIQPLVLWIITLVTVILQCIYLLPEIVLELIGLIRCRPVESAWLQSGLHLVIMILSLVPHAATLMLLVVADQVPKCPSSFIYKPLDVPNFENHLRWSACHILPKVSLISMINLVILMFEIISTISIIGIDYRLQKKEEDYQSNLIQERNDMNYDHSTTNKKIAARNRKYWWKIKSSTNNTNDDDDDDDDDGEVGSQIKHKQRISRRRWTTGTGKLLWDIEGYVNRKRARNAEAKAV